MVDAYASPPESPTESDAPKHRRGLLRRFRPKKIHTAAANEHHRPSDCAPLVTRTPSPTTFPSLEGIREACSDAAITDEFEALHKAIIDHVHKFYCLEQADKGASQSDVEHATYGLGIQWPQMLSLLSDRATRLAALTLCIAWTILSRSLLLKFGISNSPGSTFLPPEIVECFQSFSVEKTAVVLDADEPHQRNQLNFALLSRWKQISATMMHTAYVSNAFTYFDSRTANIERALKDLEPLLQNYALPKPSADRVNNLREILKSGAKFAFLLFSQPYFWQFDWCGPQYSHGKSERQGGGLFDRGSVESQFDPTEVVIWPALLRVMDGDGRRISHEEEGHELGGKIFLMDFT